LTELSLKQQMPTQSGEKSCKFRVKSQTINTYTNGRTVRKIYRVISQTINTYTNGRTVR